MFFPAQPINYDEPLFRPPSEGRSLILQVTLGCSWNQCAFCEMYVSKQFTAKKKEEISREIDCLAEFYNNTGQQVRKVFLADGNAAVLSSKKLLEILEKLNRTFPRLTRVSAYALPGDLLSKSPAELRALHDAGLRLLYVGVESGDDQVLQMVNKSETFDSTVEGLKRAGEAGIKSSVMILTGLGGQKYTHQHAANSARVLNEVQPAYASTLVLGFPRGRERFISRFRGDYIPMSLQDLMRELAVFIGHTELKRTVYRSDHVSNFLALKGTLSRDKDSLMELIEQALKSIENKPPIPYQAIAG
ncbi:MAG: radical SAM protein [bacterium]|nr:radical SAM protein [bacterium]